MDNQDDTDVVTVSRASGASPVLLVCEHASHHIPSELGDLGLNGVARYSHIAWDPGALGVAHAMSKELDATLVSSNVSRLVYDCNRPPEAKDAMPAESEAYKIPGNVGLSYADRKSRTETYYEPFRQTLATQISSKSQPVIVTVHSFTPIYNGSDRQVEIGILHDADPQLADAILAQADRFIVLRNAPYGPDDGVTHTLKLHGITNGHLSVMIEVRNDLIQTEDEQTSMGMMLASWLTKALSQIGAVTCKV